MSVFKCKMCGGDLTVSDGSLVAVCDYCGSSQTVPSGNDEKKINLFNRANRLRMNSEFDKAGSIYEQIIAEFPEEAEAYWCLCLCNYGIEYVDDPATANKVPTVHRASFEKLRKDENYELALEYADMPARILYQEEAKEIDRIMGEILAISANEKPYDIFICYKETDNYGGRTPDSVIAQDIYDVLTDKGYNVFFSRITLEDKLGMQYEPYIFAALNSAKIMLAIGTDFEYYNAVWVKNEWSRFLKLAAKDKSKVLIPCFKDIDAYDLPNEFKMLQAQDMGKLGWMQDLVRGINKLIGKTDVVSAVKDESPSNKIDLIVKKALSYLQANDWEKALSVIDDGIRDGLSCYLFWELKLRAISIETDIEQFSVFRLKEVIPYIQGLVDSSENEKQYIDDLIKYYEPMVKGYVNNCFNDLTSELVIFGSNWASIPYQTSYKKSLEKIKYVYDQFEQICCDVYISPNLYDILYPLYIDLRKKYIIINDRYKMINPQFKDYYQEFCYYINMKFTNSTRKITSLFPRLNTGSGRLRILGFSKKLPRGWVHIALNGIEVGKVKPGQTFECDIKNDSTLSLKYSGDFSWKNNVLTVYTGEKITVQLNYGFPNLIQAIDSNIRS